MARLERVKTDGGGGRPHTLLQPPQSLWSFVKFTHCAPASAAPPHVVGSAIGQTQAPPWQTAPLGQCFPQLPQLFGSARRATQIAQQISPVRWQPTHVLIEHRSVA